jgi:hypothetical protein
VPCHQSTVTRAMPCPCVNFNSIGTYAPSPRTHERDAWELTLCVHPSSRSVPHAPFLVVQHTTHRSAQVAASGHWIHEWCLLRRVTCKVKLVGAERRRVFSPSGPAGVRLPTAGFCPARRTHRARTPDRMPLPRRSVQCQVRTSERRRSRSSAFGSWINPPSRPTDRRRCPWIALAQLTRNDDAVSPWAVGKRASERGDPADGAGVDAAYPIPCHAQGGVSCPLPPACPAMPWIFSLVPTRKRSILLRSPCYSALSCRQISQLGS